MKKNVGSIDKIVRIVIAIAAGYFAFSETFQTNWISSVLYAVSGIALVTSLIGSCPLYSILGIKTGK